MRPLTRRDLETLDELRLSTELHRLHEVRDGFVRVMDCGGSDSGHQGATLRKLARHGLAQRKSYRSFARCTAYKARVSSGHSRCVAVAQLAALAGDPLTRVAAQRLASGIKFLSASIKARTAAA